MERSDQNGFTAPKTMENGTPHTVTHTEKKLPCLQRASNKIIGTLENGFGRLGLAIGTYPWRFIIGCIIAAALSGLGLLAFKEVTDPDELWVPKDSQVVADVDWIDTYFPSTVRREQIIGFGSGGNILTTSNLIALLDIYQESLTISTSAGTTLSDVCIKAGTTCIVYGILELWSYDNATIHSLTQAQILSDVKTITVSPMYGNSLDLSNYLGAITRDGNGDITAAESALMTWLTDGSEEMESATEAWESEFISLGRRGHNALSNVYVLARRSWSDVSGDAIQGDIFLLSIGYCLVILFVLLVLGKFNFIEQRVWLTVGGFVCIGLSILVSIGLSSAFQQGYGPVQSVLPFLLLGIGVDDMFVIMGALNNLTPEEKALDIPERVSKVLRHAGVSITVTSFTDFVAFMIGATTIIPALRSFCIYAGVGIIALYAFQALFFTSCLTLDLHRMAGNRDGCCCCMKHRDDYAPNQWSQRELLPIVFKKGLAKIVTKLPYKIIVIIIGLGLLGMNLWAFTELEQYFNPNWFLPTDSYAYKFLDTRDNQFPNSGANGYVYCGNLDYWGQQSEFDNLDNRMTSSSYIKNGTTDSWFLALTSWLSSTSDADIIAMLDANKYPLTAYNFENLTYRLTTEEAVRTNSYLKFNTYNNITASRFPYQHIFIDDASTQISAMDSTRQLVKDAGFSTSECFPFSRFYFNWETNKVIREELFRNLGLALVCVLLVTLILIANFFTGLMVLFGVAATLVDVAGTMHLWGLTIDTVTSIILILSIGLSVDYCAHIGHMFMTIKGSRHDRIKETIGEMGPPVFYGGFSTFLAFVLLSNSNSYVFTTFFKVNFLVVAYGLFHGLIFLPVILSWFGPQPYPTAERVYIDPSDKMRDAETGEGVSNYAFNNQDSKVKPNELNHGVSMGSINPKTSYIREDSNPESLSPSKDSVDASTPPPDYTDNSPSMANESHLPSVQT